MSGRSLRPGPVRGTAPRPPKTAHPRPAPVVRAGPSLRSGALFGAGTAAFVDEAVFHRSLHWHHLHDRSVPSIGLVADGLFHAFGWCATVIGLVMVADVVRRSVLDPRVLAGGILLGAGVFQLYDGTVQHRLLRLHQMSHVPFDLTWVLAATLMIATGAGLLASPPWRRAGEVL